MLCVRIAAIFYVECVAVLTMTWSYVRIAVIVYKKLKNMVIRDTGHNILTYRKLSRPS